MKQRFLLVALSFLLFAPAIAQVDSNDVVVAYSEELADSSDFSIKEKYKYFTRATVEETSMFKVCISGIGYGGYFGFYLEHRIAYERKVSVPFSVLLQYRNEMNGWENTQLGVDVGLRYYYSLPRRIRRGKSANNLSANYLSIQSNNTWAPYYEYAGQILQPQQNWVSRGTQFNATVSLLYGIQRRLGKRGFFDVNLGGIYDPDRVTYEQQPQRFTIGIDFTIGIAF